MTSPITDVSIFRVLAWRDCESIFNYWSHNKTKILLGQTRSAHEKDFTSWLNCWAFSQIIIWSVKNVTGTFLQIKRWHWWTDSPKPKAFTVDYNRLETFRQLIMKSLNRRLIYFDEAVINNKLLWKDLITFLGVCYTKQSLFLRIIRQNNGLIN